MTKIEKLEKEIEKCCKEREKIIEEATKENKEKFQELCKQLRLEKEKEALKFVGKCYVSTDREMITTMGRFPKSWNRYYKIISTLKETNDSYFERLVVFEFYKNAYGEIAIRKNNWLGEDIEQDISFRNLKEIKQEEFDKALNNILNDMKDELIQKEKK